MPYHSAIALAPVFVFLCGDTVCFLTTYSSPYRLPFEEGIEITTTLTNPGLTTGDINFGKSNVL